MLETVRELEDRLSHLRRGAAFRNYDRVREMVLRLKQVEAYRQGEVARPSAYWREELSNFEYMLDASPLIIEKLRHHCYHLTGIRVYDYRSGRDGSRAKFQEKLKALQSLDTSGLFVPEAPTLGGFGFTIDDQLLNIDTLKFYEVLIALDKGAVLQRFREPGPRALVWEIGAGWGGFAYQFKTLYPNVTYVITDLPEVLLFSAVYLMTMFPDAAVRFAGEGAEGDGGLFADWQRADFIFVPHFQLEEFSPPAPALTVNMVSFQEMTTRQVEAYIQKAYALSSPFLYSLNRDRSPYNNELTSVRQVIERYYWPHEVPMLPVNYTEMMPTKGKGPKQKVTDAIKGIVAKEEELNYRHVIGRRRITL